jgi:hypothetical protein
MLFGIAEIELQHAKEKDIYKGRKKAPQKSNLHAHANFTLKA